MAVADSNFYRRQHHGYICLLGVARVHEPMTEATMIKIDDGKDPRLPSTITHAGSEDLIFNLDTPSAIIKIILERHKDLPNDELTIMICNALTDAGWLFRRAPQ